MNAAGESTLSDLMLILGERVGVRDWGTGADNRITIPTNPADRDRLIRSINSGRRELYSRLPEAHCFQPRLTITLNAAGTAANVLEADPSKYRLPYAVEHLAGGQWNWKTSTQTGWGGTVRQVHPSDIATLHASTTSGAVQSWPQVMAFTLAGLNNPEEPGRRVAHYLWLWPKPDQNYAIEGQARIVYAPLVELDDLEPMGQQHLESVLTFSERAWSIGRCDADAWALLQQRGEQAVAVSRDLDNQQRTQMLGVGIDPEAERDRMKYRGGRSVPPGWARVTEVSGVQV